MGRLCYYLIPRYRQLACANIKFFLNKEQREVVRISKALFENLGISVMEVFRFFSLNKNNIDSYVEFEGLENLNSALSQGKGVILLTAHLGNWEISSVALSLKGYSMKVLARPQKNSRIDELLNSYRQSSGIKVVKKGIALREIIHGLRNNEIVGILGDQGGKNRETCVRFFDRYLFLPSGFLNIALKTGAVVLPSFIFRKGRKHQIVIGSPLDCTQDKSKVIQKYADVLQSYIFHFPEQYLWIYNFRKVSFSKVILILSDGKAGHLNQSKSIASYLKKVQEEKYPNFSRTCPDSLKIIIKEVRYRNRVMPLLLKLCSLFASRGCAGCLRCVRFSLSKDCFQELVQTPVNLIISCGSTLVPLNIFLKYENLARNILIMSPSRLLKKHFDLIITPSHDRVKGKNVLSILGTPNLITPEFVRASAEGLKEKLGMKEEGLGVLIGNGSYTQIRKMIEEVAKLCKRLEMSLLISTSRRTSPDIEKLVKERFSSFPLCRLLIIANERNIENAVAKILGLSRIVISTADSISMLSEAVNSGRFVLAVKVGRLRRKKRRFICALGKQENVCVVSPYELEKKILEVCTSKGEFKILTDSMRIKQRVESLL